MKRLCIVAIFLNLILYFNGQDIEKINLLRIQDVDITDEKSHTPELWTFSTSSTVDTPTTVDVFKDADSINMVVNGMFMTFKKDRDIHRLRSVENRNFYLKFDRDLTILPDSTGIMISDLSGHGVYGDRINLISRGSLLSELLAEGRVIIDSDTINDVRFIKRVTDFQLGIVGISDTIYTPSRLTTEYVWSSGSSVFSIAKRVETMMCVDQDTIVTSPEMYIVDRNVINNIVQQDQLRVTHKKTSNTSSLPKSLDLRFVVKSPDILEINFKDISGESYDMSFDVYNAIGQWLSHTVNAYCTGDECQKVVRTLTKHSGVYLVSVKINQSVQTFKVTQ